MEDLIVNTEDQKVNTEDQDQDVENQKDRYHTLCLSGACNRGICYLGSIQKLIEKDLLDLNKIIGVSIGSLISTGYLLGYKPLEMLQIIIDKDTRDFMDISLMGSRGAVLKGKNYRDWVTSIITNKLRDNKWIENLDLNEWGSSFSLLDLYRKTGIELIIPATCIYSDNSTVKEGTVYFSHINTPNIPITVAVNCSMTFPFVFPPIVYEGSYFIDGGLLDNYSLDQTDKDTLILGVKYSQLNGLESVKSPVTYVGKLFELISDKFKMLQTNNEFVPNIVYVNCEDYSLLDFEMSIDDKITLYKRGYNAIS